MDGIKKPGFQNGTSETQTAKGGISKNNFNQQGGFQAALNNAQGKYFKNKRDDNPISAPVSTPSSSTSFSTPSSDTSNTNSTGGFAAPGSGSGTSLRGHMAVGSGGGSVGFKSDTDDRAAQELDNELVQSGLQAQALKNTPTTGQDSD